MKDLFVIHPEVRDAVESGIPVINFESSIWGFGLYTKDAQRLLPAVDKAVRSEGAVPAVVTIIDGKIHIGTDMDKLLEISARSQEPNRGGLVKVNMWNIADTLRRKVTGCPTIAGANYLASLCGRDYARFHSTGGLGAFGRDYSKTWDMSNDQRWMREYPMFIVSSYDKGFFDLKGQKEYFETNGIVCAAYQQDNLPGFWVRDVGIKAPVRIDTPEEAADLLFYHEQVGLQSSISLAVPCPKGMDIPAEHLEPLIDQILQEAKEQNVSGLDYTPFVLGRFADLTSGSPLSTVESNLALFENNAKVCSQIAKIYMEKYV